jgi:hypothetical protein
MPIVYECGEKMKETKIKRSRMSRVSLTMVKKFPLGIILVQMIVEFLTVSIVHLFASPTSLASPGDCLAIPAIDPLNYFK